jgi:hypothetical protein
MTSPLLAEHTRRRHLAMYAVFSNPSWQDHNTLARKIADRIGADERKFQRAVGAEWEAAYQADWATSEAAYIMLIGSEHPEVLTRFHMIGRPQ